jgi:hypothetical protein
MGYLLISLSWRSARIVFGFEGARPPPQRRLLGRPPPNCIPLEAGSDKRAIQSVEDVPFIRDRDAAPGDNRKKGAPTYLRDLPPRPVAGRNGDVGVIELNVAGLFADRAITDNGVRSVLYMNIAENFGVLPPRSFLR